MIPTALEPWLPFAVALVALLVSYQLATHILIAFFYRLTHHISFAMLLYALLVWPGTVLHEVSHWLMARLLGVYARAPHLLPSGVDKQGRMVLGHVEVARTDILRRSLIGAAPLIAGSIVVVFLARRAFALPIPAIESEGLRSLVPLILALPTIFERPDVWLYLYALFAFANAMMPSPSDREAWPALFLFAGAIAVVLVLALGVPQVPPLLALWGLRVVGWLTFAFLITAILDTALLFLLWPLERILWLAGR